MEWLDQAKCKDQRPAVFFPTQGGDAATPKRICMACPVRQQCLDYALAQPELTGIWGGTSHRQREKIRWASPTPGKQRVARCGTESGYTRHRRWGEDPCDACKAAHALAWRERNDKRRRNAGTA
jgi:WhiB family redox-sensing transcriptional regulator